MLNTKVSYDDHGRKYYVHTVNRNSTNESWMQVSRKPIPTFTSTDYRTPLQYSTGVPSKDDLPN